MFRTIVTRLLPFTLLVGLTSGCGSGSASVSGDVTYDGEPLEAYDKDSLHRQIGFAFQDAFLFNMTLRENIAFSADVPDADLPNRHPARVVSPVCFSAKPGPLNTPLTSRLGRELCL